MIERELEFIEHDRGEWSDYGLDLEEMSKA